jgi:ABC-type uncharacterized transport system, ATPase component
MTAIHVENLSRSFTYYRKEAGLKNSVKNVFHRKQLVKDAVKSVSFDIEEGEMIGFLGPNGAGKTTTLKMLSGILFPTGGSASVLGYTPWERKKEFKKKIAIVMGQKSQLFWDLPANESFLLNRYIYELSEKEYRAMMDELTEMLDAKELMNVQVRRLSLGERMKMELIAALIHRPRVMFLDEPTIGLDLISQKKIQSFIKYYNEQSKTTVLLTSHYMNDIENLCRRSIIINMGEIMFDGDLVNVNALFSEKKRVKLQLQTFTETADIARFGEIKSCDGYSATLEVNKQDLKQTLKGILDTLSVVDFNIEDIPIEEGIMRLYHQENAV